MATIAIDYDGTFTADPELWCSVIELMRSRGHVVICATARKSDGENDAELKRCLPPGVDVVFCGDNAKENVALNCGHVVDIWIDDNPERCKKPFIPMLNRMARR